MSHVERQPLVATIKQSTTVCVHAVDWARCRVGSDELPETKIVAERKTVSMILLNVRRSTAGIWLCLGCNANPATVEVNNSRHANPFYDTTQLYRPSELTFVPSSVLVSHFYRFAGASRLVEIVSNTSLVSTELYNMLPLVIL